MNEFEAKLANELLDKKYNVGDDMDVGKIEFNRPISSIKVPHRQQLTGSQAPRQLADISWKDIAEERKQVMTQFIDECHAWQEAYNKERERTLELEKQVFELAQRLDRRNDTPSPETQETRVEISPAVAGVRKKRHWPEVKANLEKQFATHDAGTNVQEPEN